LLCAQLADAVGERRQQNLPGTRDEYPNWRLALADGAGAPVLLDAALSSPGAAAIASALRWRP
jgi:4-alpha-glucanotransferase